MVGVGGLLLLLLLVVGLEVPGRAGGRLHLVGRVEGRKVHLELIVVLPARTQGWNRIWIRTDPGPFARYGFPKRFRIFTFTKTN